MSTKKLLDHVPQDVDRCIVIYPVGDKTACAWVGMKQEDVLSTLYSVADELVGQLKPPDAQVN